MPESSAGDQPAEDPIPPSQSSRQLQVLLVEDNPADAVLVEDLLRQPGRGDFEIQWANGMASAAAALKEKTFDVVLLDLNLDESRGLDTFDKVHAAAPTIPIVILSGLSDEQLANEAVRRGAQDYVVKGSLDATMMWRTISYAIERKRTLSQLLETQEQLAGLFQHVEDVLFTVDANTGAFLQVSPAARSVLGLTPDAIEGNASVFHDRLETEDRAALAEALDTTAHGTPALLEVAMDHPDRGARWLLVKLRPGRDAGGNVTRIFGILSDITRQKAAEKARHEAFAQRMEIQRLKEINDFKTELLNTASHELNTPLTPLKIQMHMLRSGRFGKLTPEQTQSLDVLQRNFDRLSRLVRDILDVARLQGGRLNLRPHSIDLGPLVRQAVSAVAPHAADVDVRLRVDGVEPLTVVADGERLRAVFESMIGHTLRYTPRGGKITILLNRSEAGGAHLAVADETSTLSGDDLEKMFQPFATIGGSRKQNDGAGPGLGLYMSRGVIEAHGGRLWAEQQEEGGGTVLHASLPANASVAHASQGEAGND